jgi:hypothetical protein
MGSAIGADTGTCARRPTSAHRRPVPLHEAGLRTRESLIRIAFPRHIGRSGIVIRIDSLTVAGAVPEWSLEGLHWLPVSPSAIFDREDTSAGQIIPASNIGGQFAPPGGTASRRKRSAGSTKRKARAELPPDEAGGAGGSASIHIEFDSGAESSAPSICFGASRQPARLRGNPDGGLISMP